MIIYPIFQHFLASSGQLKPCLLLHILLVWVRELNTNCFDTSSAQVLSIFVIVLGGWKRVCEYAFTSRIAWNLLQLPIGLTRKMLSPLYLGENFDSGLLNLAASPCSPHPGQFTQAKQKNHIWLRPPFVIHGSVIAFPWFLDSFWCLTLALVSVSRLFNL